MYSFIKLYGTAGCQYAEAGKRARLNYRPACYMRNYQVKLSQPSAYLFEYLVLGTILLNDKNIIFNKLAIVYDLLPTVEAMGKRNVCTLCVVNVEDLLHFCGSYRSR